ncbi:His Kinase A (phospho-acceptor) domain-containing protein [Hymenobacter gelipurpurascens]|uniref:histidine kinase n=1 Tax=Hymenobacter gelipurpurascens TaxID=89968 RepID=A0A212TLD6_9BACT|nr:ATP-binding protein [Hymenobacter gelipurpurascens]SNC66700.1 His Kinase A (phospho-acceptor) domain-containing protein [Hymenobacter gelipurpurascens]
MKARILLLLALFAQIAFAQADQIPAIVFREMPPAGLMLSRGWKYHPGDNLAWARPETNDQGWQPINPTLSRHELPQLEQAGQGWLRLRFQVGPVLRRKAVVLRVFQFAASEIYFNGQLVRRYGTLSPDPAQVQPYWPDGEPIELTFRPEAEQVLAVRFSQWPQFIRFSDFFVPLFFQAHLDGLQQVMHQDEREATFKTSDMLLFGLFLLLSCLHMAFFIYNPAQRANLYFTLYTLAVAVSFCCTGFLDEVHQLDVRLTLDILSYVCLQTGGVLAVHALYSLFAVERGAVYYGLWAVNIVSLFLLTFSFGLTWYPTVAFMVLVSAEQLRLTLAAIRQSRRSAGIIAAGFAMALVLLVVFGFLARYNDQLLQTEVLSVPVHTLLTFPAFLSPVLAISLFLARQFALDSRLLKIKLNQVRMLSEQTMAQQREKQVLLAQQNETLERQVQQRTSALQRTLYHLQTTQDQLVQSEKMASLGELTAGIAHEIQNPLNFVNNFADVAVELLQELKEGPLQTLPATEKEYADELVLELTQNLDKIHSHGHRADSIVKGMLEHSRSNTGERQPTNLNALCDEYLRLAYHGLRAKDPSFNATLTTDFDSNLGLIEVVPQDMGRVLLNLFNNAFYAVQKRKQEERKKDYQPEVKVQTRRTEQEVHIVVHDNGTGIPAAVVDKIYQPFFTTKPSGEGTGLGLSLSYDIVTKIHHGTLRVESREGQCTEFTVCLPVGQMPPVPAQPAAL